MEFSVAGKELLSSIISGGRHFPQLIKRIFNINIINTQAIAQPIIIKLINTENSIFIFLLNGE